MMIDRSAQRLEERKCHFYLQERQEEEPRELQTSQPHLSPWESNGAANPGKHFQAHEIKKITRTNQHELTKGKSCSINLINFYVEVIGLVEEGRAVDLVYLDFSKTDDTVSHKILLEKVLKSELDEQTVRWIENWLNA
ncbi:mitochondrial enolase superfamily member 1 [Grus japonensis]|uniref:Mitochondrial enolase superfamily member 1 n=1 Tax=Grus japonensis TaxID=30415 RepID=A0ABC9X598_GRUJA